MSKNANRIVRKSICKYCFIIEYLFLQASSAFNKIYASNKVNILFFIHQHSSGESNDFKNRMTHRKKYPIFIFSYSHLDFESCIEKERKERKTSKYLKKKSKENLKCTEKTKSHDNTLTMDGIKMHPFQRNLYSNIKM